MTTTTTAPATVRLAGTDQAPSSAPGSIEGYELSAARRALSLLKTRLGRQRLLELLADEIDAATAYLRDHVERSARDEIGGTTTLHVTGLTATGFTGWLARAFGREDVLIAGHPEHYSIDAFGGRVNIVETLGAHVCSFYMLPYDEAAAATAAGPSGPVDPGLGEGAVHRRRSRMALEDGTVFGTIANDFHDEEAGFRVHLSVTLPATCGADVVEHHLEHCAVEFRSWILRAAAETAQEREHEQEPDPA